MPDVLTLDSETSTHNKGNPFDKRNFCVTIHTKVNNENTICKRYTEPDFLSIPKSKLVPGVRLVGHNVKFDLHWMRNLGVEFPDSIRVWDTMLAEFVLSGQVSSFASLDDLAGRYGLPLKKNVVAEYWDQGISTEDIPPDIVEEYGNWDVDLTYQVYLKQLEDPRMTDKLKKLIFLEGADLLVLQKMEYNGLKYNKEKSLELAATGRERIKEIESELLQIGNIKKLNFDSDDQLSCYLYGGSYSEDVFSPHTSIIKTGPNKGTERTINKFVETIEHKFDGFFSPLKGTELKKKGYYSTAGDVLKQLKGKSKVQKRIISLLCERADLAKLTGTYYEGLPKLMDNMNWTDRIHGQYNQVVARTGRLSSSKPNMQNNPPEADMLFESRYD